MNLHQRVLGLRQRTHEIVYAVVRGDRWTVGAAVTGLYLIIIAGLLQLFGVPLLVVDAGVAAGVLACGVAWVRALHPGLDQVLTAVYLAGAAGFLVAIAQDRTAAAVVLLGLVAAATIALTITRIAGRARTGRPTDPH